jgi:hypothetical protein
MFLLKYSYWNGIVRKDEYKLVTADSYTLAKLKLQKHLEKGFGKGLKVHYENCTL